MATIEKPRKEIKVNRFIITTDSKRFVLTIHESNDMYRIYIGGYKKYCVEGFFFKPSSPLRSASIKYLTQYKLNNKDDDISASLSHVYYDKDCGIDRNFERGTDTRLLIKLLASFIHKYYPKITKMYLSDASTRRCDNGTETKLYETSYITSGKTWYQKNFNAYLEGSNLEYFTKMTNAFQEKKKDISWDSFKGFVLEEFPIDEDTLKQIYDNAPTWQDFFGPLSELIGPSKFCIFVSSWLHGFMETYLGLTFNTIEYVIPIESNLINFKIIEHIQGGKTYKAKKYHKRKYTSKNKKK